jgi:hypothetical protein
MPPVQDQTQGVYESPHYKLYEIDMHRVDPTQPQSAAIASPSHFSWTFSVILPILIIITAALIWTFSRFDIYRRGSNRHEKTKHQTDH